MEKRRFFTLDNTPLLIALSVITALVVCFLTDPIQKATFTVPLEYVNQSALADMDLALADTTSSYTGEVTLTVVGRSSALSNLNASELLARADFSEIDQNGMMTVHTGTTLVNSNIMVYSCEPQQVRRNIVSTNRYDERSYTIATHVQTNIQDEFELIKYTVKDNSIDTGTIAAALERNNTKDLTDEEINTLINSITRVEANIDVSERTEPYNDTVALCFLDKDGNRIAALDELCYAEVEVIIGKRIDVRLSLTGSPQDGFYLSSGQTSPLNVAVYSVTNPAYVSSLDSEIMTEAVSIEGKNSSFTVRVQLMLPDEVVVFGNESKTVNAIIKIEPLVTGTFSVGSTGISYVNMRDGLEYQLKDSAVTVTLSGPDEAMESINAEDLRVQIDLSDAEAGANLCPVTVLSPLPSGVTQSAADTAKVIVTEGNSHE